MEEGKEGEGGEEGNGKGGKKRDVTSRKIIVSCCYYKIE